MLETLQQMGQGFVNALTWINLLAMAGGVALGIVIGVLTPFIIGGVILFEHAFSLENEMISTISTILMGGVGFAMVFRISRPFNWKRAVLLGGLLTLFVGTMLIVPGFLSLSPIDFQGALVLVVFALLIPSVLFAFSRSLTWLSTQIKTWFEKRRAEK